MQEISKKTATFNYELKLEDGTLYDTNFGKEPLTVELGEGKLIKGFEQALLEMKVGETKEIKVPSELGYGQPKSEYIQEVDRKLFNEEETEMIEGTTVQGTNQNGMKVTAKIVSLTEDKVKLDANPPLVGKDLYFKIHLLDLN